MKRIEPTFGRNYSPYPEKAKPGTIRFWLMGASVIMCLLGLGYYKVSTQPYETHDLRGVCVMEIHPTGLNGFATKPCGSTDPNLIGFSTPLFPGVLKGED